MNDLFGQPIIPAEPRLNPRTGKPVKKSIRPNGYAYVPGTGPAGETCKTCAHLAHVRSGKKVFLKCLLRKHGWTCGPGTDILAKSPACKFWKQPA